MVKYLVALKCSSYHCTQLLEGFRIQVRLWLKSCSGLAFINEHPWMVPIGPLVLLSVRFIASNFGINSKNWNFLISHMKHVSGQQMSSIEEDRGNPQPKNLKSLLWMDAPSHQKTDTPSPLPFSVTSLLPLPWSQTTYWKKG